MDQSNLEIDTSIRNFPVIRMKKEKAYTNADVELLYNAFKQMCNYVAGDAGNGCAACPRRTICYGKEGPAFTAALQNIKKSIK